MDGDFNVGRWFGQEKALLNQRMLALRGEHTLLRLLEYALPTPLNRINEITYATTVKHLSSDQVRAIRVSLPIDVVTRRSLAGFLNRETAEIDEFIADQEKLIVLLTERRSATISHAVTKGLDPSAPVKDSGVEWIGEVPADWGTRKLGSLFARIGSGTTPARDKHCYFGGSTPWVTTSELRETVINATKENVTDLALAEHSALKVFPEGSLLIAMYGATVGRLGILGIPAAMNQACCAFAHPISYDNRFGYYVLGAAKEQLILLADGGGQPNISQEKLRQLRMPMPSLIEQTNIVSYLDKETAEIDATIADAREAIALSKERRTALISAAVTGKIDVRNHGANIHEEVE